MRAASAAIPQWWIGLAAFVGAWVGHFFEFVRVAGWHAGVVEMSSSAHTYFFPAGAALTGLGAGGILYARHVWAHLGRRMRRAETALWHRPAILPAVSQRQDSRQIGPTRLWLVLSVLQGCTWALQENLEAVSAGHRAPLLGVVTGVHWLAPLVQAAVALALTVACSIVRRLFIQRRSRVALLEQAVARKWCRTSLTAPAVCQPERAARTPLERWGAQRWQRPPPAPRIVAA